MVSDVIYNQGTYFKITSFFIILTLCSLVVHLIKCTVLLLACGVPNVELVLASCAQGYYLCEMACVNGTDLTAIECILAEAESQGRLAYSG